METIFTADQRLVDPMVLVLVVLAVTSFPLSSEVRVYVPEVAPEIEEH